MIIIFISVCIHTSQQNFTTLSYMSCLVVAVYLELKYPLQASQLDSFSWMCFSWTYAVGAGPLWLVGDRLYAQANADASLPKGATVQVSSYDPVTGTSELKTVKTKDVRFGNTEIADLFPHPPPASFTWRHMVMLYDLVNPDLCEMVAKYWASKDDKVLLWGGVFAQKHIVFLWAHDTKLVRTNRKSVYEYLQLGAKALKKLRKTNKMATVHDGIVSSNLDSIWKDFQANQIAGEVKHYCAGCGTTCQIKCKSCQKCGIRYCSESCQLSHWEEHKAFCQSRGELRSALRQ